MSTGPRTKAGRARIAEAQRRRWKAFRSRKYCGFATISERMPRGEDHGKKRPAQLHLPCQINSAHGAGKPDVREDHGDLTPADQHDRKRGFRAFTLDGVHFFVFEQRRR